MDHVDRKPEARSEIPHDASDSHPRDTPGHVNKAHEGIGNKRLALAAVIPFYGLNGRRLTLTNDEAYDLVMSVAEGRLDTVDAIAAALATEPRR